VVVRDNGTSNTDLTQHVEAVCPGRVVTDLVDLIDGKGVGSKSNRGRTRECQAAAPCQLFDETVAHSGVPPMPKRVRRTARPGKDVVRVAKTSKKLLDLGRSGLCAVAEGGETNVAPHVLPEV